MRFVSLRIVQRALSVSGQAAVLLAMGALGPAAPGQDGACPPQGKDQPRPTKAQADTPKHDDSTPASVKLGLLLNDPRASQGYTLISPFNSSRTLLIDMQGRVVRSWDTGCAPALSGFLLDNGHLMRPGSIGGAARVFGPGPGVGGRIQEFTWDGELVWDFRFYNARQLPHHDMTRLPNGNVLLIVWDRKTAEEAIAAGRRPEMTGDRHLLVDSLVEIRPTGKTTGEVVWEWHLWDHLLQDFDKTKANFGNVGEHSELVNINYGEDELPSVIAGKEAKGKPKADGNPAANWPARIDPDYTHFNGVDYNPDLDQIAVSVWIFSEFWIIDHGTTTAQAASHTGGRRGRGGDLLYRWGNPRAYRAGTKADRKLFAQHNAHWIPRRLPGEGHLLLFNNGEERPDGSYSSVDELVLPVDSQGRYSRQPGKAYGPDQPVWSYTAPKKPDFYSSFASGAQRLSNGNTLICSSANGTIFEVTPEKAIVWKYIVPIKDEPPFGMPPRPGQIMPSIAGEMLEISAGQRKQLDHIQKDVDDHLDKLLSADQKKRSAEWPQGTSGSGIDPPPQPGQVMAGSEQDRLRLTDDQKKAVLALQKAVDGRFYRVLTAAQKKQITSAFAPPDPPPGGPGDPVPAMQQRPAADGPGRGGPPDGRPLFRALRYATRFPGFAGKDLIPGESLEAVAPKDSENEQAKKKG